MSAVARFARGRCAAAWTVAVLLLLAGSPRAIAAEPASRLSVSATRADETRAHALFRQIRCVVCQNESIDDSEAPLAGDLRQIVREQIGAGRGDAQIRRFLTDRYGEFVLLKPRFSPANALLWSAPFLIVLAGLGGFVARRPASLDSPPPLSAQERLRLREITAREGNDASDPANVDTLPPDTRLTKGYDFG